MIEYSWRAITAALALWLAGCAASAPPPSGDLAVTIMTFNAQNLFDTRHDEGKNDYTYLPAAQKDTPEHRERCAKIEVEKWRNECAYWDWNDAALNTKLERLARAILENQPGGADILVFQEVENLAVLERLRREHLADAGYLPAILLEGRDDRGIDVAFLAKLPVRGEPRLHRTLFTSIEAKREGDTRGILEATFELPDGELLTGFAVHFPAPFHPPGLRVQSYRFLDTLVAELPPGRAYFAAGDFNTTSRENDIIEEHVAPNWLITHRIACDGCRGTYYYAPNDDWSFLDMVLLSPDLAPDGTGWALVPERTRVANAYARQVSPRNTPAAFDLPEQLGVSDHWPLIVELRLRRP